MWTGKYKHQELLDASILSGENSVFDFEK